MSASGTETTDSNPAASSGGFGNRYTTFLLLLLGAIAVMVMYVEAMAIPALPWVMADFGLGQEDYALGSWIVTIYLVVAAVAIAIFGKLGDIYGKKKMLLIAMSIYTVAVTLTGFSRELSDSIYLMIGFRAIQGLGMSAFPLAFAIIRDEFPNEKLAVAQGVISAMFGVGNAFGLVVGGYVTEEWGWQWTYHTVIPFSILATAVVAWKVRPSRFRLESRVDILGGALLALTLVAFLIGATEARNLGWTDSFVLALFAVSSIGLMLFVYWQMRAKDPLIRPSLMKVRDIALANAIGFMIGFGMLMVSLTITAIASYEFGLGPLKIGMLNLPMSVMMFILGPIAGVVVSKVGPKWPTTFGMCLAIVGFIALDRFHASELQLVVGIVIMGSGIVCAMVGMINLIIISTPKEETGIVTGVNIIVRTCGAVVGPAVATVLISDQANMDAYGTVFKMGAAFLAVGAFLTLFFSNKKVTEAV
ncbi:MAG: MFS transporter [Methanobacteriota archaeon]|nr:MAG: MFS transporter [Euryarchaeota archaeon]